MQSPGLGQVELNNNLYTVFARARAFMPPQFTGALVLLKLLFEDLLHWFTRPVEVLIRQHFGARGHSLFQVVQIAYIGFWVGTISSRHDFFLTLFCLASGIASLYRYLEAVWYEKHHPSAPRYSWSHGEPSPLWGYVATVLQSLPGKPGRLLTVENISRYWEPLLCLVAGMLVQVFLSGTLGTYLCCAAGFLVVKASIIQQRVLNMQRDSIDGRILSKWMIGVQRSVAGQFQQQVHVVRLAEAKIGRDAEPEVEKKEEDEEPADSPAETGITTPEHLNLRCKSCDYRLKVSRRHLGKVGKCKRCGNAVPVEIGAAAEE